MLPVVVTCVVVGRFPFNVFTLSLLPSPFGQDVYFSLEAFDGEPITDYSHKMIGLEEADNCLPRDQCFTYRLMRRSMTTWSQRPCDAKM